MGIPEAVNKDLENDLGQLISKIKNANNILLTTHKQCDGDGLGSQIALYFALKKMNKNVRLFCVDDVPRKYHFLNFTDYLEVYTKPHKALEQFDLTLIFDTNDSRLVEPFYSEIKNNCDDIVFVDHHPILTKGPKPTDGSFVDSSSASTGEITYYIIKGLGVELDNKIARPLYTSIAFDTQVFKFIRNCGRSHVVAADLLKYEKHPEEIHRNLFAAQTRGKMQLLAQAFSTTKFIGENEEIAILTINISDLVKNKLEPDDSRDILDMIMSIESIQVGALLLQINEKAYKLSLRSRGEHSILKVAESFGGGGHNFAAGAYIEDDYSSLYEQTVKLIKNAINNTA